MSILLAMNVDPGASSGYAIGWGDHNGNHTLLSSGTCTKAHERSAAVSQFAHDIESFEAEAEANGEPFEAIVVMERWSQGGARMTPATYAGLGAQAGRWQENFELHLGLARSRYVRVYPQTWRSKWGGPAWSSRAAAFFEGLTIDTHEGPFWESEDELTALAMLWWSLSQMPIPKLIVEALPKRFVGDYRQGVVRRQKR